MERGTGSFGGESQGAQAELAGQKKEVFFQSVLIAMSRRMQPTAPAEGLPEEMMTRGISGTGYLERFRRFWKTPRAWLPDASDYDHNGFLQVGNLPAARDATALLTVTFRPSKSPALARGTPSHGVLPQACQCPCEDKGIHSVGLQTVGDRCTRIYKGAGCHICKAFGAHKPDQAKPLCCNLIRRYAKAQADSQKEGKRRRKGECCSQHRGARRLTQASGNACSDFGWEGPEPNPLVAKITFQQWISCLRRWILRTHTKFAALLARSFAILRCSEETATTLFPLRLPSMDCFRSSGPNLSRKRHLSMCRSRLLNMFVLVLDFLFLGRLFL